MTSVVGARSIGRKRWTRLIPVAIIVYIISFMDRTNIGFALNGLHKDLGIDAAQQGLAAGIFFIGYLTLQIPGGHLAEKWSAKKFVGIMILIWGVLAVLCGFIQNFTELLVVRFFLGVAEAGIWPAILVLISHWFPAKERARAYAFWIMNIAIASIITAPLSGWILSFSDWRTLFIVEGLFPFVIAAPIWWIFVSDRPRDAKWCSPEERTYIEEGLAADAAAEPHHGHVSFRDVLSNGVVWRLTLVYFLIQIGFYGINIWLPKVVKTITGGSSLEVGFVTAIPYVLAMVGLWYNAKAADRTGRYSTHVLLSMAVGAVTLVISVATGDAMPFLAIAFISIAVAGALAYDGPFWASASRAMPVVVAGTAMGLINAVGNLGGFVGPYVGGFLQDATHGSFLATSVFLAACLLA
ncbi:MAG TPA: MFS transporter, partial [Micrococcaceae bacterium]|nr:MFS transporter [Micrococcaceae bacterium]